MEFLSKSEADTRAFAARLAKSLPRGSFLALRGGLGAGKTCFVSALAEAFGCLDPVSSPTFAIVNLYRGKRPLAHFDLYRITADQLEDTGFFDYLDQGVDIACEWSENIPDDLPDSAFIVTIEKGPGETDRRISVSGGAR